MNAKEYFCSLNDKQVTALASFIEGNWDDFKAHAGKEVPSIKDEDLGEISEFVCTCLQPQFEAKPDVKLEPKGADFDYPPMGYEITPSPNVSGGLGQFGKKLLSRVKTSSLLNGEDVRVSKGEGVHGK